MFCPKCGTALEDGATFCTACGEKLEQPATTEKNAQKPAFKLPINPKMIVIALVAIVAVVGVVIGLKSIKKKINLSDYIQIKYEGYDGLGTATYRFDSKELKEDFGEKLKIDKKGAEKYLNSIDADKKEIKAVLKELDKSDPEKLLSSFKPLATLDVSKNLSNGDEVELTFTSSGKDDIALLEAVLHCKVVYEDVKDTVSGLKKVDKFDPFETFEITYSGTSPNGRASYDYDYSSNEALSYFYVTLDKSSELSNGDKITVTFKPNHDLSYIVEQYGRIPSPTEKVFTVEGLPRYAEKVSEVSDEALSAMISQASDVFAANKSYWASEVSAESFDYIGGYLLSAKNGSSSNRFTLVFKVRAVVSANDVDGNPFNYGVEYYYPITFYNVMIEGKETKVDVTRYDSSYNSFYEDTGIVKSNSWWTTNYTYNFNGYQNLEEVYTYYVTRNLESYNHDDAIKDKESGAIGRY